MEDSVSLGRNLEQFRQQQRRCAGVPANSSQHSADAIQIFLGRKVVADIEPVAQQCLKREQNTVTVVGRALAAQ